MINYFEEAKQLQATMARGGVRVFKFSVRKCFNDTHWVTHGDTKEMCFVPGSSYILVHGDKTTEGWRKDVRGFLESELNSLRGKGAPNEIEGHGDNELLPYRLYSHLLSLGYCDISDVVSDCYEGAVAYVDARIVDSPAHEEQQDGFGHFGWESKGTDKQE